MKSKMAILAVGLLVLGANTAGATGTSFGVDAGASLPSGDYSNAAKTGWHAGGTGTYMINSQWGIGGDVNYHRWGASDELNAALPTGTTASWSAIQATPHVQFRIPTQTSIKPYAQVGVGVYNIRAKVSDSTSSTTTSDSKVGFNFGGGMDMVSGNSMSWGIDTGYHIVSMDNNTSVNNITFGLHMKWGMSN
jgi:outer membrane protein W